MPFFHSTGLFRSQSIFISLSCCLNATCEPTAADNKEETQKSDFNLQYPETYAPPVMFAGDHVISLPKDFQQKEL
ncbi:hypothetical protein E2C01_023644 [Portunus trituberculatus]|uniref:Uncharacterized protein n=1 Tax=Portunus trituberculatus TaxID=210409 RepID=A0A5B7E8J3_PORTR|nr:hypothetical protein [Portunus trituberculatus]